MLIVLVKVLPDANTHHKVTAAPGVRPARTIVAVERAGLTVPPWTCWVLPVTAAGVDEDNDRPHHERAVPPLMAITADRVPATRPLAGTVNETARLAASTTTHVGVAVPVVAG